MALIEGLWQGNETPPARVLAVDDDPTQRMLMSETLDFSRYAVSLAESGAEALRLLKAQEFDVVLLDKNMPGMDGDEACQRMRNELGHTLLPILMVTGTTGADGLTASLKAGADDFIRKPYLPVELQARVDSAVQRKRTTDQLDSAESLLFALARMVEAKDENTGDHCSRLSHMSVLLGQALGLSNAELLALRRGGVLHDIGKLGIPDAILMKPAALTEDEWAVMRQHTAIGANLVGGLKSMRLTAPIVRHHHERWDGSGYPDGLAGQDIPLLARVFQVVDIYDALVYSRPYKPAFGREQALGMLADEAARGWRDPLVIEAFIDMVRSSPQQMDAPRQSQDDLGAELFHRILGDLPGGGLQP